MGSAEVLRRRVPHRVERLAKTDNTLALLQVLLGDILGCSMPSNQNNQSLTSVLMELLEALRAKHTRPTRNAMGFYATNVDLHWMPPAEPLARYGEHHRLVISMLPHLLSQVF